MNHPSRHSRRPNPPTRRAAALVVCVLIIGMVNLAVLSSVNGGGDDARLASARADTSRAFYAAESGAALAVGEYGAGRALPSGTYTFSGGESVTVTPSGTTTPITVEIIGRYGQASRRIELTVE